MVLPEGGCAWAARCLRCTGPLRETTSSKVSDERNTDDEDEMSLKGSFSGPAAQHRKLSMLVARSGLDRSLLVDGAVPAEAEIGESGRGLVLWEGLAWKKLKRATVPVLGTVAGKSGWGKRFIRLYPGLVEWLDVEGEELKGVAPLLAPPAIDAEEPHLLQIGFLTEYCDKGAPTAHKRCLKVSFTAWGAEKYHVGVGANHEAYTFSMPEENEVWRFQQAFHAAVEPAGLLGVSAREREASSTEARTSGEAGEGGVAPVAAEKRGSYLGKAASVLGTIHRPISVLSPRSKKAERVACEVVAEPKADEAVVGAAEGTADDGASAAA